MAAVSHAGVVDIFGVRFDSWSASAVFEEVRSRAGLPEAASYGGAELTKLADELERRRASDRVEQVVALLREAAGPTKPAPAPAAPVKEAAPAAKEDEVKKGRLEAPRPASAAKTGKRSKKDDA